MRQIEREYRNALDALEFSDGVKERMTQNLMEQKEEQPVKRRFVWTARTALIAAAACAALVMTAGAAVAAARQARVTYLDREQFKKEYSEYLEKNGTSPNNYSDSYYTGMDFKGTDKETRERWWQGPGGELVEDAAGTPEEGWTGKRVFRYTMSGYSYSSLAGKVCTETRYRADRVSGLSGLFDQWNLSLLEENYTTSPYGPWARTLADKNGDNLSLIAVGGEFSGKNGARFNMSWCWDGDYVYTDEYRPAGNYRFEELYTTPDGMEVDIRMDTSETGKSVFWASFDSGHNSFNMHGTQVELEEIHNILDSLNLSALLEYAPE